MLQKTPSLVIKWSSRQVVIATLFVVFVFLAFWLLFRFREVLFLLFIAIILGTATKPAVDWLATRRVPRVYGEVLVYILLLLALAGFILLAVPMILEQSTALASLAATYYGKLRELLFASNSSLLRRLAINLPFSLQLETLIQNTQPAAPAAPGAAATPETADLVAQAFQYAGLAVRVLFSVVAVFLMGFYWSLEGDRAIRSIMLFFPADRREEIRSIVEAIQAKLGGYLLGQSLLCLTIGGLQLIAYLIIGLPNALVLGLIAGVMEAVPTVGPALGALPALLIAASTDPSKIIWVLASTGVIQFLENNLLVPRIMDKSVGVNPLLTLLSLAALSSLMGLPGALMAIPIAAILQLIFGRLVLDRNGGAPPQPEGRDYISYLRLQAQEISQDVRKHVRNKEEAVERESDEVEDAIEALANDLDRILAQVNQEEATTA